VSSDRPPTIVRWEDWSGAGLQLLALHEGPAGVVADLVCIVAEAEAFAARVRVRCDPGWRCRELDVEIVGAARTLALRADGHGRWTDGAGAPLPALEGCVDVDLPITPFTNTLPIRRLGLRAGEHAEIPVVYVHSPALTLEVDRQIYTCLAPLHRYHYAAADGSFSREIEVDARGLVLTYPGLFRRRS
jgi:hypothetical protein